MNSVFETSLRTSSEVLRRNEKCSIFQGPQFATRRGGLPFCQNVIWKRKLRRYNRKKGFEISKWREREREGMDEEEMKERKKQRERE